MTHPKFEKARAAVTHARLRHATRIPELPAEQLTDKRVRELMTEPPLFLNLVALFGDQHYVEFIAYAAQKDPELVQRWLEQAIEHDPTLKEMKQK